MMPEDSWQKDRLLIERWQNGDDQAFDEIYLQNFSKVEARLVKNLGISSELAEEMFGDAMIVLHQKKQTFIVEGLLSTFLYVIAKNKSIDELRKSQNKMSRGWVNLEDWQRSTENLDETEINVLGWSKSAFNFQTFYHDTDEEDPILAQALQMIRETVCGRIFHLQYWEGMILKEVAHNLNMNESYIRRKVKECERELKKIIEQLRKEEK